MALGAGRREREEEGERKSNRTVRGGVRKERGPSGGYRENVRKMSQLVELGKI